MKRTALVLAFGLATLLPAVAQVATVVEPLEVDCRAREIRIGPLPDEMAGKAILRVSLATRPQLDPGCRPERSPQFLQRQVPRIVSPATRRISFADLGLELDDSCGVYVASAQVVLPSTGESLVASCAPKAAEESLNLVNCGSGPIADQIENDLIFSSYIDLGALGGGTCGNSLWEYLVRLRNHPGSGTHYDATIDARYICSSDPPLPIFVTPTRCETPMNEFPGGPGENQGSTSFTQLPPGDCFRLIFNNGNGGPTLPRCCDDLSGVGVAAVQCASFSVTAVGADTCSPAYFSQEQMSHDGQPHGFACKFTPVNQDTRQFTGCDDGSSNHGDVDLDGIVDGCDDCPDGEIGAGEECEGTDLGGATCADVGCVGGTPSCTASCALDYSTCTTCCNNNGVCESGEDCSSCVSDCISGTASGAECGNGVCEAGDGENCSNCSEDCNGVQSGNPANRFCCGDGGGQNPVPCSDSACSSGGFQCTDQPVIVSYCCGDAVCNGNEDTTNCDLDCGG